MPKRLLLCAAVVLCTAVVPLSAQAHPADGARTNATYFNNAALPAADPYVLHDKRSGYYYAYSTDGADPGYYFGVYRSADLATWEKVPGGALPVNDPNQWGNDWFWAPEVYFNPRTRLYYMFYAARSDANKANWFGYADFEEPSKIGVAVSRSPAGPFHNIANQPIDYNPYDPDYHDVNLMMGPDQKKPPATLAEGETAPLGTYIPFIDPDVFFDSDGRTYLYFSRNAYRNWVWDTDLGKYIEESNIYAVELTNDWWNDPRGRTMPTIAPKYRGANAVPGRAAWAAPRRLGADPRLRPRQAGVGERRRQRLRGHRRREEGPPLGGGLEHAEDLRAQRPPDLLPDVLGQQLGDAAVRRRLRDGEQPARPVHEVPEQPDPEPERVDRDVLDGARELRRVARLAGALLRPPRPAVADRAAAAPVHRARCARSGLAGAEHRPGDERPADPVGGGAYSMRRARSLYLRSGSSKPLTWQVASADGALLALDNPLNRVRATSANSAVASVTDSGGSAGTVVAHAPGRTTVTLTYQREHASGAYVDVYNGRRLGVGAGLGGRDALTLRASNFPRPRRI